MKEFGGREVIKFLFGSRQGVIWGVCMWKGRRHPRLREQPQPSSGRRSGEHARTHRGSWRKGRQGSVQWRVQIESS